MESILPRPEDHCRIQILVKPLGQFPLSTFNRVVRTLERRLGNVEVAASANTRRQIKPKLVTELNTDLTRFGEFQAFRKVFGLVGVGQFSSSQLSASASSPDLNSPPHSSSRNESSPTDQDHPSSSSSSSGRLRRSSLARFPSSFSADPEAEDDEDHEDGHEQSNSSAESKQLKLLKEQYAEAKQALKDQLVDSRCALFGFGCDTSKTAECQCFPGSDDLGAVCDHLESLVYELIRSIYFVLESRRLDTSFERMDNPPCPCLPDEEKYRMGLENVKSKAYRKKCIGRLRKKVGDYAFLTGLFESAIQSYQSAIDLLKSTTDLLWLAAAYEGWCCAAMMIKYRHRLCQQKEDSNGQQSATGGQHHIQPKPMPRVHTTSNSLNTSNEHQLKASIGHQRYCSDEAAKLHSIRTTSILFTNSTTNIGEETSSTNGTSPQLQRRTSQEAEEESEEEESRKKQKATATSSSSNKTFFFGGKLPRKPWRQLLNLDSSSSSSSSAQNSASKIHSHQYEQIPMPSAMSSASRSSSAQNLSMLPTSGPAQQPQQPSSASTNGPSKPQQQNYSRGELFERFRSALENYSRFSFAVMVEYECVMRAVHLLIFHHQFIEVETFLREHTCRFLDDKFVTFNNTMKSNICLATAEIYNQVGFRRKFAFFLRLAVFFRLFMDNHSEQDYRRVYPILNESLIGYGIHGAKSSFLDKKFNFKSAKSSPKSAATRGNHSNNSTAATTFSLQVKAVHEVCTVAVRAGLRDMAIRHLCFMLESFFDQLDRVALFSLVEELHKLTQMRGPKEATLHVLAKPLTLDSSPPVFLSPLQLTRIPTLNNFHALPLPAHLATQVVHATSLNFDYSPFQNRAKKDETHWVVDCASEVSVQVQNPLPVDLMVNNLALIAEGCQFEAIPIRLNLPSCFGSSINPSQNEVKLLGVPRSAGLLKITGYTCEVLGCKNLCKFPSKSANSSGSSNRHFTVRVLPAQPLMRIESSLKRVPTLSSNPNEAIAETCVFTGQSQIHTITLCNSSDSVDIKQVTIKMHQPQTCGGPNLVQIIPSEGGDENSTIDINNSSRSSDGELRLTDLKAGERRTMDIRIFGIDPNTTALSDHQQQAERKSTAAQHHPQRHQDQQQQIGQEQRVFVRRPTSTTSSATIVTDSGLSGESGNGGTISVGETSSSSFSAKSAGNQSQRHSSTTTSSSEATPLLDPHQDSSATTTEEDSAELVMAKQHHDLIPYIGRLLSAECSFSYSADLATSTTGEEYKRFAKLPMAITIVPAVNVSAWHVLSGDSPCTRYVVVEVTNQTDREAELNYGPERQQQATTVQPKETCRVPLLCPCCQDIHSSAFQRAAQQGSHMMQMQVIDRLRRQMERHLTRHLEIRWRIDKLKLEGLVPIGSLLSSVSFLRQLVLSPVTVGMELLGEAHKHLRPGDDIPIQLGIFEPVRVSVHWSMKEQLVGELSLACYQDGQEAGVATAVDCASNMLICGPQCFTFVIEPEEEEQQKLKTTISSSTSEEHHGDDEAKARRSSSTPEGQDAEVHGDEEAEARRSSSTPEGQDAEVHGDEEAKARRSSSTPEQHHEDGQGDEEAEARRSSSTPEEPGDEPKPPLLAKKAEEKRGRFEAQFSIAFCFEGIHKVRPVLRFPEGATTRPDDQQDMFLPSLSFNVISK